MVFVEKGFDWLGNQLSNIFGNKKVADPEDPASLVGTFSRYKYQK
jgi:hypothetical protein